jgi:hypothetical protein
MKWILKFCLGLIFITACKPQEPKSTPSPDGQSNTGSCRIKAIVRQILPALNPDTNDICYKNRCDAVVHVERIMHCCSAEQIIPDENGEITVHFVNSMAPPGDTPPLYIGSVFSADVKILQKIGGKVRYDISSYSIE